jgi:hypothetical protein
LAVVIAAGYFYTNTFAHLVVIVSLSK